jgi:lactate dehydrogenase-like 2-hydroxyacid dehydrogenase
MTGVLPGLLQIGSFPPEVQAQIDAGFARVDLADVERDPSRAGEIRAIVTRSNLAVPAALVERLPNLEIIATNGVGYDLIPLALAASRGIVVTNTPDVLTPRWRSCASVPSCRCCAGCRRPTATCAKAAGRRRTSP